MPEKQVISTSEAPDLGAFVNAPVSPAVRVNGFLFVSGYVPFDPETSKAVTGPIESQARRTLENLKLTLEKAGSSLEKVVKVNIFLAEERDFVGLNAVYREFFPEEFPARRTILAHLIGGFRVEIDCIALA